jgi:hypothetical protein
VFFTGRSAHDKRKYSAVMEPAVGDHGQPCVKVLCRGLAENATGSLVNLSSYLKAISSSAFGYERTDTSASDSPLHDISEDLTNFFNHLLIDLQVGVFQ